jgi:hypothetical protein
MTASRFLRAGQVVPLQRSGVSQGERGASGEATMSLKAFHVLFLIVCVLFALGFAYWAVRDYRLHGGTTPLILCLASLLLAIGLLIYGRWFLRKLKGIGYL